MTPTPNTENTTTTEKLQLTHPWLVAVWPGMGNVALGAGYYLLSKLSMQGVAEFEANDLFDVDYVEVKGGVIQAGRRPRNRLFVWKDPKRQHDLVVFLGEAQPPVGKYPFCRQLIAHVRELGVERVFTFAAMATQMNPAHRSRVFGAATDPASVAEIKRLELEVMEDGHIGGLNGVLLGAATENGLRGTCLLGEMPHVFVQVLYPKAALAILEVFVTITGIDLDLTELAEQVQVMDRQLGKLLERQVEELMPGAEQSDGSQPPDGEDGQAAEPAEEERLSAKDREQIEQLFEQAATDRAKTVELKKELDRLGVFKEYEDRFLDLFA